VPPQNVVARQLASVNVEAAAHVQNVIAPKHPVQEAVVELRAKELPNAIAQLMVFANVATVASVQIVNAPNHLAQEVVVDRNHFP